MYRLPFNLPVLKKRSFRKLLKYDRQDLLPDILLILLGAFITAFGINGFLIPNNFLDGGTTGISLFIHEIFRLKLAWVFILVNIPLLLFGLKELAVIFILKTLLSVIVISVCVAVVPYPLITSDKMLVSVFGGFFLGAGWGLTARAGATVDSIDVLTLFTFKRSSFSAGEIFISINAFIFLACAYYFGMGTALYSMLTYFIATKTADYIAEGIEAYTGVTIISGNSESIKEKLVNQLGRGITIYKGERGFLPGNYHISTETDIIFTVVTRIELRKVKNLVEEEDPKAFMFVSIIKEAGGGIIRRHAGK